MKRWIKITIGILVVLAVLSLLLKALFPSYFADVRCVGELADGTIVEAAGDDCKSNQFKSVVILELNEEGAIEVGGDEAVIFEP
ncbi:MAG: hypothetical protein AAGA75_24920 [Cyanobacteria bacterium P01_E01_bin.6]